MPESKIQFEIAPGRIMEIATGKLANLANGACTVRLGDSIMFVAACSGPAREDCDFFPLQVDYREKYSAAGKFPGGYIKREGRPSDKEILTCRVTDRPIRPLFPEGFFDEVQVQGLLLSADGENEPDVLCMLGASAALTLSDLPFQGPIGALRVGYVDGKFVANPTHDEMAKSSLELIYAGTPDKVIMIEGEAKECSEEFLGQAMQFANEIVKVQVKAQLELAATAGRKKKEPTLHLVPEDVTAAIKRVCDAKLDQACFIPGKEERLKALSAIQDEALTQLVTEFANADQSKLKFQIKIGFDKLVQAKTRGAILHKGYRPDGRGVNDLRALSAEVGLLPIVHGSGLFSRGETQALVIATLGGDKDSQEHDAITRRTNERKHFYLHYNFPNYSVGEVGRISGPGRREIGHGNLAERSVAQVIPEDFPYTVRCVSEIMSSNGSTSMASVCGAILALMDAGVPIKAPVAGISCGLITEGDQTVLLTDIIGAEDHFGDMDFKVCGTRKGITGFQLDLKLPGISIDLLCEGMQRNKTARFKIIDVIEACMPAPRSEVSKTAPKLEIIRINPAKIGALIGPGGKNIKEITEVTGATIDISDDGTVKIFARNFDVMEEVKRRVNGCTAEAEIGKIYRGTVKTVKDFGAFVEIMPGQEGLLHISEMANYRVAQVSDICKEGDHVSVKVVDIDRSGKIRLSRKAALEEMEK
ncbi:MAG: polyribonucleotide nucleotidyltransferase [Lentisphaerae bacterium GWF2_52_8]|nr:MAG: polyribonucleotide nucleotidyltransferase [Lentisphaerae bacterium GWF2_52_8]